MLSKKDLNRLANNAHERTFPAGTVLTEQDESGVTFGVVVEGQAAVTCMAKPLASSVPATTSARWH